MIGRIMSREVRVGDVEFWGKKFEDAINTKPVQLNRSGLHKSRPRKR